MALQIVEQLVIVGTTLELTDRPLKQATRHHLGAAQGHQTLDNQGDSDDGSKEQRPDWPASGLNDSKHVMNPWWNVSP